MKIGLTGNLASGKSTVTAYLRELGYAVVDADLEAHLLYQEDALLCQELAQVFGHDILDHTGGIIRPVLAQKVFTDTEQLAKLNELVRPALRERLWSKLSNLENIHSLVFLDAALIFEGGLEEWFTEVWLVDCPLELRLQRAVQRGMKIEDAKQRTKNQMSDEEKRQRANRCISNDADLITLKQRVDRVLGEFH